jgi:metal-dependent amidase/aminoacylase/carboxypeptidase family protein
MRSREELKQAVCAAIDKRSERIIGLVESIMDQPELGFKEERTAHRVGELFKSEVFDGEMT